MPHEKTGAEIQAEHDAHEKARLEKGELKREDAEKVEGRSVAESEAEAETKTEEV